MLKYCLFTSHNFILGLLVSLSYNRYHVAHSDFSRSLPNHLNDEPKHPIDHLDKGDDGDPGEQAQGATDCGYLVKDVHPNMAWDEYC